jgi:hypothetical protein
MMRQLALRAAVAAVALITLPVLALAAAPGTALASAPSATLQFLNQARLQPDGSVLVTLNYSCLPSAAGSPGILFVAAEQPGVFGQNGEGTPATCDGNKHMVTIDLAPGPFTRGTAAAIAEVINFSGTSSKEIQAELKVH